MKKNNVRKEPKDQDREEAEGESEGSGVHSAASWRNAFRDSSSGEVGEIGRVHQPRSAALMSDSPLDLEMAKLRFGKRKLYGRENEVQTLLSSVLAESSSPERSIVLVDGTSGVGKSVLVSQLEAPIRQAGGIYALGKYDFQHASIPYPGVTLA